MNKLASLLTINGFVPTYANYPTYHSVTFQVILNFESLQA